MLSGLLILLVLFPLQPPLWLLMLIFLRSSIDIELNEGVSSPTSSQESAWAANFTATVKLLVDIVFGLEVGQGSLFLCAPPQWLQ